MSCIVREVGMVKERSLDLFHDVNVVSSIFIGLKQYNTGKAAFRTEDQASREQQCP